MNPETIRQLLWFAKIFQMISAAILTPEIIGPDRFERLEKFIESQNYLGFESAKVISALLYIGIIIILIPWVIVRASTMLVISEPGLLERSFLDKNRELLLSVFWIAVFLKISTFVIAAKFNVLVWLIQSLLSKFAMYLRRVSLFRVVSVVLAVVFFFLGTLLEIVLEFPY